jgi:hypothetical protein
MVAKFLSETQKLRGYSEVLEKLIIKYILKIHVHDRVTSSGLGQRPVARLQVPERLEIP